MIIAFANQKGGVGKTTLAIIFANYLTMIMKENIFVSDMDYQRSILAKFTSTADTTDNQPYPVEAMEMDDFHKLQIRSDTDKNQIIIIDLPGKLDDDRLIPILQQSDLIICPFIYDEITVTSTYEFAFVIKQLNTKAQIAMVPNKIKGIVKYGTLESVNAALAEFGEVLPPISDRIAFTRLTTAAMPHELIGVVEPTFKHIYQKFIIDN